MNMVFSRVAQRSLSVVTIATLLMSVFGVLLLQQVSVAHATEQTCSTLTLLSDSQTQTAGYTETNPLSAPLALTPSAYSEGGYVSASATETVIPPWIDPATESAFTDAAWISSDDSWPGGEGNSEGSEANDQWRLYSETFELPAGAVVNTATLSYTADNATEVYLEGAAIDSTGDVYEPTPESGPAHYASVFTEEFSPVAGENTLEFVVRNWSAQAETNPTGLLYKATIEYCVPDVEEDGTSTVTIVKYVDGQPATAQSADATDFPMSATWNAENLGEGSGDYTLSENGFGEDPTPYRAQTTDMTNGADYSTYEHTDQAVVGASCEDDKPYALEGYKTGSTLQSASEATMSDTAPAFTDISEDQFVIVYNESCDSESGSIGGDVTGGVSGNGVLTVTSIDAVDTTATANGSFEDGWEYIFNITIPTNETNLSMKFDDWMSTVGSHVIAVAGNMRISSAQADNGGATILLTAEDTYSLPPLHMITDLDPVMHGIQTQIKVEVAIPSGSANGAYTTNYGVRTLP